jgi:VanZ family protein
MRMAAEPSRQVRTWRWLLAAAMLALMVLSLMPASPSLPSTGWDKTNHMLGFAVLAFLGHFAWPGRRWSMLLGLLAYGGLVEVLQSFTPDRLAEFGDLVADGVGLLAGQALAVLCTRAVTRF